MPEIYTAGLLNVIAEGESKGNYNAYFGNAANTEIQFTEMTVAQVLDWQQDFVAAGNASSAVGRYQFIDSTLRGLVQQLRIDDDARFDSTLQDRLANALLERRGLRQYVNEEISRDEFAHNLSKEWAALPAVLGDTPQASYYADDGLNAARLTIEQLYKGIETVQKV